MKSGGAGPRTRAGQHHLGDPGGCLRTFRHRDGQRPPTQRLELLGGEATTSSSTHPRRSQPQPLAHERRRIPALGELLRPAASDSGRPGAGNSSRRVAGADAATRQSSSSTTRTGCRAAATGRRQPSIWAVAAAESGRLLFTALLRVPPARRTSVTLCNGCVRVRPSPVHRPDQKSVPRVTASVAAAPCSSRPSRPAGQSGQAGIRLSCRHSVQSWWGPREASLPPDGP